MEWIWIILRMLAPIIILWIIKAILMALASEAGSRRAAKKNDALLAENKVIDRNDYDYYKQAHIFTTKTSSIAEIGNVLNKTDLMERKITFKSNYGNDGIGMIEFHQRGFGGSFAAALRSFQRSEKLGLYRYRFQVEAWYENEKIGTTQQDVLGANILLTAIERAFFQLDENTEVQRVNVTYKEKVDFF